MGSTVVVQFDDRSRAVRRLRGSTIKLTGVLRRGSGTLAQCFTGATSRSQPTAARGLPLDGPSCMLCAILTTSNSNATHADFGRLELTCLYLIVVLNEHPPPRLAENRWTGRQRRY